MQKGEGENKAHQSSFPRCREWPEKMKITASVSLVVMGQDIKQATTTKIIRKQLQSVNGILGLTSWIEQRREEIAEEEDRLVSSFPSRFSHFLEHELT